MTAKVKATERHKTKHNREIMLVEVFHLENYIRKIPNKN